MMVLISYDVCTTDKAGAKRLRKISKECVNYGQRVQNSVFEVFLDYSTFLKLKDRLLTIIDDSQDSLRIYYLGNNYQHKIEHFGIKDTYDPTTDIIV